MKEVYELMKKTLSRFLCALLVVAMVCAMAPAALAEVAPDAVGTMKASCSCTVSYTDTNGAATKTYSGEANITVNSVVSAINPSTGTLQIDPDSSNTGTFNVTLTGYHSGDSISVSSNDNTIATAEAGSITGDATSATATITVTALKKGTTDIKVSCNTKIATCTVTVKDNAYSLSFGKTQLDLLSTDTTGYKNVLTLKKMELM
jgi:hypothetical protein